MQSLRARNGHMRTFFKYMFDDFGALVSLTLHLKYVSTCFLVEHLFEIDVRAVACLLCTQNNNETLL